MKSRILSDLREITVHREVVYSIKYFKVFSHGALLRERFVAENITAKT